MTMRSINEGCLIVCYLELILRLCPRSSALISQNSVTSLGFCWVLVGRSMEPFSSINPMIFADFGRDQSPVAFGAIMNVGRDKPNSYAFLKFVVHHGLIIKFFNNTIKLYLFFIIFVNVFIFTIVKTIYFNSNMFFSMFLLYLSFSNTNLII